MNTKIIAAVLCAALFSLQGAEPLNTPAVNAIRKGDFNQAVLLFRTELKADPGNKELKRAYAGLMTARKREQAFAAETQPAMAVRIGRQLRRFYYYYEIFAKAEPVDRKMFQLDPSTANGVNYGITLLNIRKNQEAMKVFASLDLSKGTPLEKLYAAQAFARMKQFDRAEATCRSLDLNSLSLDDLKIYARIMGLGGKAPQCAQAVIKILEQTHAQHHPELKKTLFADSDFDKVAKSPAFLKALQTQSKAKDECAGCTRKGTSRCDD